MKKFMLSAIAAVTVIGAGVIYQLIPSDNPCDGIDRHLRVGVEDQYHPFSYTDPKTKERVGFDVDIAKAVCDQIGTTCTIEPLPFEELFTRMRDRELDVIVAGLGATDERKKLMAFSNTYYRSRSFFITNTEDVIPVDDIEPKKLTIGVQKGSIQDMAVTQDYEPQGSIVKRYETYDDLVEALRTNKVNVILSDGLPGYALLKSPKGKRFFIGGNYAQYLDYITEAKIAVHKDDANMIECINRALMELQASGEYQKLSLKHFPYMNY